MYYRSEVFTTGTRLELHDILKHILGSIDSSYEKNLYFQPPETIKMNYPCIVYKRASGDTQFADNSPYIYRVRYEITVIDENPDSLIPGEIAKLPMCIFDRNYTADNLNHDVYDLYF